MEKLSLFLFSSLLFGTVLAFQYNNYETYKPDYPNYGKEGIPKGLPQHPIIYEMNITSNISNRFAKTLVASKVKNGEKVAKETTFTVVLPEKAFISEFVMETGGKRYNAYVEEKKYAKEVYTQAVASGLSAGHVAVSARDSNKFTISVNVEPESKITFLLTYEELLERKNDQYELVININPGQIVENLNVKVQVNESRPLKFVRTPSLRSGNEISKNEGVDPSTDIQIINSTTAAVTFDPNSEKQREYARFFGNKESDGLSGQFVVQYDVERDPHGGEVLLHDGYFVHFFAPSGLTPLPKHVIFVLDSSGSMAYEKIQQVKDAINRIIDDLREEDIISVVDFGSSIYVWDIAKENRSQVYFHYTEKYQEPFKKLSKLELPAPVAVNNETLAKARKVLNNLEPYGGTNVIGGLETALYLAKVVQDRNTEKRYQPMMIFLTDGFPNIGISSTGDIVDLVARLNSENNVPIYSLSFGSGADKDFLRKLSAKNSGFSRHIYEDSDASLQLQEFYKQISSPLLSNITFEYGNDTTEVTKTYFPVYFQGSELVIAGRYYAEEFEAPPVGGCIDTREWTYLQPVTEKAVTSLERLWAYLTVKQTLEERELSEDNWQLTNKALEISLKYSFVTNVTSLVVVKPNGNSSVNPKDAYDGRFRYWHHYRDSYPTMPQRYYQQGPGHPGIAPNFPQPARVYYHQSAAMSSPAYQPGPPPYQPYPSYQPGLPGPPGPSYYQPDAYQSQPYQSQQYQPQPYRPQPYQPASHRPARPPGVLDSIPLQSSLGSNSNVNIGLTTATSTSTTIRQNLVDILPWLSSVLNSNGTVTVGQRVYELGDYNSPNLTTQQECPQTPLNSTENGKCSVLSRCPQVHSYLTDFSVFQRYFCEISTTGNVYAGVCCPVS